MLSYRLNKPKVGAMGTILRIANGSGYDGDWGIGWFWEIFIVFIYILILVVFVMVIR